MYLTSTIIAKTAFGAGIIAMPYTVRQLGYILAPIAFIMFFIINQFCSNLLLKCKNLSHHSNYSTIIYDLFHKKRARVFMSIVICIDNFSTCKYKFIKVFFSSFLSKVPSGILSDVSMILILARNKFWEDISGIPVLSLLQLFSYFHLFSSKKFKI